MLILQNCLQGMIDQARRDAPNETCGLLTGRAGRIEQIHALKNVAEEAEVRYEFEPMEHFRMLKKTEREGVPILGVYHSHTASQAYPSATDVERALLPGGADPLYPGYLYIIISLQNPAAPVVRGFWIRAGGEIQEEALSIVGLDS
ncbi:M67 family metallopeptidase [bacterium]|nr:M67 family metallopeptidase [bacterium]